MNSKKISSVIKGWLFIGFGTLIIVIFCFYPMIEALANSFQTGMGMNLHFCGLANYKRLLVDPIFLSSVKNTFLYLIVQVPVMLFLAMLYAVLLNDKKLKCRSFFRIAIFLPCVTSLVAYAVLFKSLFSDSGFINQMLMTLHVIQSPIHWLTDAFWGKITIIIAITWRWTGYNMIFFLSALQNIDPEIYEAAEIDGANVVQKFFSITAPLLKPIILFTSITSISGTLQLFDEVVNLTQGGPGNATITMSQYIYNLCFKYTPDFGYASAVSYAILLMIVVLTAIQFKVTGGKKND